MLLGVVPPRKAQAPSEQNGREVLELPDRRMPGDPQQPIYQRVRHKIGANGRE